jgi:1,6-anhydro-N-acetylmuramate kinase
VQALGDAGIRAVPAPGGPRVLRGDQDITAQLADVLNAAERATLASLYCAQMVASRVQLLGAPSPLVVEGPLARNPVFVDSLSALLPGHECRAAEDDVEGTAHGAWLLMHWTDAGAAKPM